MTLDFDQESGLQSLLVQTSLKGVNSSILVQFDLRAAAESNSHDVIKAYDPLTSPLHDDIVRTMALKQIEAVGALGNSLTLFDIPVFERDGGSGKVLAVLELVREVSAFANIKIKGDTNSYGLQFVKKDAAVDPSKSGYELRLVALSDVDASASKAVFKSEVLAGKLVSELFETKDGRVVFVLKQTLPAPVGKREGQGTDSEKKFEFDRFTAYSVVGAGETGRPVALNIVQATWDSAPREKEENYYRYGHQQKSVKIAELAYTTNTPASRILLVDESNTLREFQTWSAEPVYGRGDLAKRLGTSAIKAYSLSKVSFLNIDGRLFLLSKTPVKATKTEVDQKVIDNKFPQGERVSYNEVAEILADERGVTMGPVRNVPGVPTQISQVDGKEILVTNDTYLSASAELTETKTSDPEGISWDWDTAKESSQLSLLALDDSAAEYGAKIAVENQEERFYSPLASRWNRWSQAETSFPPVFNLGGGQLLVSENVRGTPSLTRYKVGKGASSLKLLSLSQMSGVAEDGSDALNLIKIWQQEEGEFYAVFSEGYDKIVVKSGDLASQDLTPVILESTQDLGFDEPEGKILLRGYLNVGNVSLSYSPEARTLQFADPELLKVRQYRLSSEAANSPLNF